MGSSTVPISRVTRSGARVPIDRKLFVMNGITEPLGRPASIRIDVDRVHVGARSLALLDATSRSDIWVTVTRLDERRVLIRRSEKREGAFRINHGNAYSNELRRMLIGWGFRRDGVAYLIEPVADGIVIATDQTHVQ